MWDKEVNSFPKGIRPKVNIMARLEFELAYYEVAVHQIDFSKEILLDSFQKIFFL